MIPGTGIGRDVGAELQSLVTWLQKALVEKAYIPSRAICPSDGNVKPGGPLSGFR